MAERSRNHHNKPQTGREAALRTLYRVETEEWFAGEALERELSHAELSRPERALATELAYGVLRWRGRLDCVLGRFLKRPLSVLTPWIRNILRLGTYQLLFLDRIPQSAAVDESVKLARRYGHEGTAGLVNGVLRTLIRQGEPALTADDEVDELACRHSHPRWLVERWLKQFGRAETEALLAADNQVPPVTVRVNTLRTTPDLLREMFADVGVAAAPCRYLREGFEIRGFGALSELPGYREGLFVVQDEAAMLVSRIVAPEPGEQVIDACAAPGGKTTHLAELMHDQGHILAVDAQPERLRSVDENCGRLGLSCVETVASDARTLGQERPGWADRILVDAPCSGLGTLRRRPDARWRKEADASAELASLQSAIVEGVLPCLRPGGTLTYSTCTIDEEENQAVMASLLARHPELMPDDLRASVPAGLLGAVSPDGWWLQTYPHRHGVDGFFVARVRLAAGKATAGN